METQISGKKVEFLLKESYVEIYHVPGINLIGAKWIGFLSLENVKKGCSFLTKFIRNNQVKIHLSDHRQLKVLSKEVQAYLTQEWFVEVEKIGLTKVGAVVSKDIFAVATVSKVNKEATIGNLQIDMFQTEEECVDWLLS
ncbi:MAG: hypothetical protein QM534_08720 [Sediminibacterium sp.]|nr:hypothetical protein [Sediminibacterium sp.]